MEENNEWKKRYEEQASKLRNFLPEFSINDFLFIKLKGSEISVKKSEAVLSTKKNKTVPPVENAVESLKTGKKMKNVESKEISESKFFVAAETRSAISSAISSFKNSKSNTSAYNFLKYIGRYKKNPFKDEIAHINELLEKKSPNREEIFNLMKSILAQTSSDKKYKK